MTWLIVGIVGYFAVAIGFLLFMYLEAPKHAAQIGAVHFVVAVLWPVWVIWYLFVVVKDWRKRK